VATSARSPRVRLDQLLLDRGLAETRSRAQSLILAGKVRVGEGDAGRTDRKAGDLVDGTAEVAVLEPEPYVSRGGHKLAAALEAFSIDPAGRVCLDVGASTGGFSDVLLQRGAARVYAVDVGRGQLAESVRADPRTVVLDRTNARALGRDVVPEPIDLAAVDVSFISLRLVLGPIVSCLAPAGRVVALVKPQFEAGRGLVKGGVVRDPTVHRAVIRDVVEAAGAVGLGVHDVERSPITGPEGNREFLLDLRLGSPGVDPIGPAIDRATA
jgi:23S rRNA (cytidine1920-2'-O)/16S rRNA (cytidine1409-2'-O)-methyltransferase